nr:hypothetical protein GCM10020063_075030 [Dactylosporangium thailandense]
MYLNDVVRALSRQWIVVILGVILTAGLGYQAARVTPVYLASEVLVVKYPVSPDSPNPLTGLYPPVAITAAAVATSLRTPAFEEEFRRAGMTGTYEFAPRNTGTNQEPRYIISSLTVSNTTDSEEQGLLGLRILTAAYTDKLKELQDRWNVRQDLRFTVSTLVAPSVTMLSHSAVRALLGSALLGGLATLAVPLWVDKYVRRRRRIRAARKAAEAAGGSLAAGAA